MCLAVPMKVIEVEGNEGVVELNSVKRRVNFGLLEDVRVGEYVIVHAGFAIQKVEEKEAETTLSLLRELEFS
ncbi:HypC/HybG/HupF family hydrogenase formation chaperone [Candidatus Calescamantes bacterium]|nr:HypC/HybG/HupF family hydrogenase formation chaperone [Candidatus Calescamantes bacterium]